MNRPLLQTTFWLHPSTDTAASDTKSNGLMMPPPYAPHPPRALHIAETNATHSSSSLVHRPLMESDDVAHAASSTSQAVSEGYEEAMNSITRVTEHPSSSKMSLYECLIRKAFHFFGCSTEVQWFNTEVLPRCNLTPNYFPAPSLQFSRYFNPNSFNILMLLLTL